jgi:hypothetical protein
VLPRVVEFLRNTKGSDLPLPSIASSPLATNQEVAGSATTRRDLDVDAVRQECRGQYPANVLKKIKEEIDAEG